MTLLQMHDLPPIYIRAISQHSTCKRVTGPLLSLHHLICLHYDSVFSLMLPKGDPRTLHLLVWSVRSTSKRWTKPCCVDINKDAVLTWCHNNRKHIVPHCLILPLLVANLFPHLLFFSQKQVLITSFFQHCLQRGDHH